MSYKGRISVGDIVDFKFTSRRFSSGAPFALASGAVKCYKSNSTAPSTAGITLTSTFASVTGLNHVRVETTSDSTFYAAGSQIDVVMDAGTVDAVSVVGEVVGRFVIGPGPVDVKQWNGSNVATPNTVGVPLVDMGRIAGSTISTTSAQVGANMVQCGGTAVTGRDIGASVLLSSGTGAGQMALNAGKIGLSTAAVSESYAANGAAPNYDQMLYAIHQSLMSFAISSTTISVKKLDGATQAFTVTLNSTAPTQAIRS